MMNRRGFYNVFSYLDDFLVLEDSFEDCQRAQMSLIQLLISLGFNIYWKKCSTPSQSCKYLGIWVDSVAMNLSLPQDKLDKFRSEIEFFEEKSRATKKQLQRLCGIFNHCSRVVRGGRIFTNRIVQLLKGLPDWNVRIRLTKGFKSDLCWWKNFSKFFNGVSAIIDPEFHEYVFTDASKDGYGIVHGSDWLAGFYNSEDVPEDLHYSESTHQPWVNLCVPERFRNNINVLEVLPLLLLCRKFGPHWRDRRVLVFSDNTQLVSLVNKGSVVNHYCMDVIRFVFWESVRFNFQLHAVHIPGKANVMADYLSRIRAIGRIFTLSFSLCCSEFGRVGHTDRLDN